MEKNRLADTLNIGKYSEQNDTSMNSEGSGSTERTALGISMWSLLRLKTRTSF